ncbi:hypothetical protein [Piscinibacter defluvii]|uniref:hypothetical protein n=1 Tax=Piscinibacter defluvii TaxID=1796922 RepID=UPI000FDF5602|nr:hypothetical protein [Piscinibacter defluvii]
MSAPALPQRAEGAPVKVLWAVSPHRNPVGCEWCDGEFLRYVAAPDTDYRVLVRSKTPRGNTVTVPAHPSAVEFVAC